MTDIDPTTPVYDEAEIDALYDSVVYGTNDEKIGEVGQIYLDDADGRAEWLTIKTGIFGLNEVFVPLRDATIADGRITVPYTKQFIKDAPGINPDDHIGKRDERDLYAYYGVTTHPEVATDGEVPETDTLTEVEEELLEQPVDESDGRAVTGEELVEMAEEGIDPATEPLVEGAAEAADQSDSRVHLHRHVSQRTIED